MNCATRKTVVVDARDRRVVPSGASIPCPVGRVNGKKYWPPPPGNVGSVAEVVLIAACSPATTVDPPVTIPTLPQTSQSPAVSEIEVTLALALLVNATADPEGTFDDTNSPTLPAFALLFVVVPTMPAVCEGVIAPVAIKVVTAALLGVVLPNAGGVPNCPLTKAVVAICVVLVETAAVGATGTPVNVGDAAGANPLTHVNPAELFHPNAKPTALHSGIANAVGAALKAAAFASTVLLAIGAMPFSPMPPHAGAVLGPVDTIACPLVEPVGLRSPTGFRVVAKAASGRRSASAPVSSRFISSP